MSRPGLTVLALLLMSPVALGQAPMPPAAYPFPVPPVEIIDRLAKADLGTVTPLAGKERTAVEAVWKTRGTPQAKTQSQTDAAAVAAHLSASGVADPKAAADYAAKLDALTTKARKAVAGAANARVKADALLRFLHQAALAKGYSEDETTLSAVFDGGKYNCVSSASLYYLVGTRLGLKLQPVRIPAKEFVVGHAACDLLDGKNRVQVEPTTPYGFDFAAKGHPPGVVVGYQPDRSEAVDTDGFGLASSAASNRGIGFSKADPPRPAEAVRCYALALALDPSNMTARKNLQAELVNWGLRAADAKRFDEAVKVNSFAAAVLGKEWTADDGASRTASAYGRWAAALAKDGKWEEAVAKTAEGLKAVPGDAVLTNNGPARVDEWAAGAAGRKDWAEAVRIYEAGLRYFPDSDHLKHNKAVYEQRRASGK
jgi:tetratricopeptide (TPR) repeat protein